MDFSFTTIKQLKTGFILISITMIIKLESMVFIKPDFANSIIYFIVFYILNLGEGTNNLGNFNLIGYINFYNMKGKHAF